MDIKDKNGKAYISPGTYVSDQIGEKIFVKATVPSPVKTNRWQDLTWEERDELARLHLSGFSLGRLYNDVLNDGKKIRVIKDQVHEDAFVVETYDEFGWWIFKIKDNRRTKYIFKGSKIVDIDVVYE